MPDTKSDVNPPALSQELLETLVRTFLLFLQTAHESVRTLGQILRETGSDLKPTEWDVLGGVAAYGPARPAEILRVIVLTGNQQTMSSIVSRLEARDLITRTEDETDSRSVILTITEKGERLVELLFPVIVRKLIEPFNSNFTDQERQVFDGFLARLQVPEINP